MTLFQRIGYYLGGFSIGLIILAFFLNGKKTSCSYGPDARVLKNIRQKKLVYSPQINTNTLDTTAVLYILNKGDINFTKSDARKKPCGIYVIEGDYNHENMVLTVENCDSTAVITNIKISH